MNIFNAFHIEKKYADHLALDDVNIHIPEGSIYGLLGPNGAGKTTLIRIINQIIAPDKGELFLYNKKLESKDVFMLGYLPEERGLYRKMKVEEHALYLAQLKGLSGKEARKKLNYWFEKFEISAWRNKKIEELSKGMQQKLQFIVTVLHEPKLLIFDEPFTGFDPINMRLLKEEILELRKKGATIVFSTHDMGSVEELCDHITLINKSRTIIEGPVDEIKSKHKSNIFKVEYKGDFTKVKDLLLPEYRLLEHRNGSITIKIPQEKQNNDLLALLLPAIEIISFKELIPNMNDIFITLVEAANKSENQKNE